MVVSTALLIASDAHAGTQAWGELFEVPLMSAMFLAMVWHARRRQDALAAVERQAEQRASLLERQERFVHDASHELRTPVTIARGHLEVLRRTNGAANGEVDTALDELERIERILDRLLFLAKGHGGRCTARSDANGSTFSLSLPRFQTALPPPTVARPSLSYAP